MNRIRSLFRRQELESNLDEELEFHVEMKTRENIEAGLPPDEALAAALRQFGNIMKTKETTRIAWSLPRLESILQDFRYGFRQLRHNPGFTAVAVLTLALGIGANTAIFSFVSVMLLREPPIQDPARVMKPQSVNPAPVWGADRYPASVPDFLDWRAQSTTYLGMAASAADQFTLSGGAQPERVGGWRVTANYFNVLGVNAELGRTFAPGEDEAGHEREVILSEGLWKRLFAASPQVVGQSVKLDGEAYTVIGVMPARFQIGFFESQLWVPLVFTPAQLAPSGRSDRFLDVVARLKPGASPEQAKAELAGISRRLAQANPDTDKGWGARVVTLKEYIVEESNVKTALLFLMSAVGFVLLIACANLANLLLARNSSRQREFTVRAALGAGRLRLAQQLLSECMLISLAGASLGLVIASLGLQVLRSQLNWNYYSVQMARELSIDTRVLVFTLVISLVSALVFGLAPAFQISRLDLNEHLKEDLRTAAGGRERHRIQRLLVIGELALSLILLVGAGLFVRSFIEEIESSPGIEPHNILTASVSLAGSAYRAGPQQIQFFQEVLRRAGASPGVQSAALTSTLPLSFPGKLRFELEGRRQQDPADPKWFAPTYEVSSGYFETVRIPLIAGRFFQQDDNSKPSRAVIISREFARRYFGNQDPLGKRLRVFRGNGAAQPDGPEWSEIVGMVGDVEQYPGESPRASQIYELFEAYPSASMYLVVHTRTDPAEFAATLRNAVWAVDKDQAVTDVRTMDRVADDSNQGDNLMTELMTAFAGIALVMAAIGIYGLLAYLVGRRTHEIGIRVALGASRRDILRMVLRNALPMVLTGVGIGFMISLALPALFSASFVSFRVQSAGIIAGVPVLVTLIAFGACYLPARRASRVDPTIALRCE